MGPAAARKWFRSRRREKARGAENKKADDSKSSDLALSLPRKSQSTLTVGTRGDGAEAQQGERRRAVVRRRARGHGLFLDFGRGGVDWKVRETSDAEGKDMASRRLGAPNFDESSRAMGESCHADRERIDCRIETVGETTFSFSTPLSSSPSAPFLSLKLTSKYEGLVRSTGLRVCSGVLSLGAEQPERAKRIKRPKLRPFFFLFFFFRRK